MRIFNNGTKAFDFFLNKNFQYSTKNGLRILSSIQSSDLKRYNYDAADCDWKEFFKRNFLGCRRYYFRESHETTDAHRLVYLV